MKTSTIEKLESVKKRILKDPTKFNMSTWFDRDLCGTTMCIGGNAVVDAGYKFKYGKDTDGDKITCLFSPKGKQLCYSDGVDPFARRELGITKEQAKVLFYSDAWPEPFKTHFEAAEKYRSPEMMAKVAIKRIDYFIENGE